jgi:hypothetical protein
MNKDFIVTVYYVIDEMLKGVNYQHDQRSQVSAAEVLTVAVIAARYFHNHWERALYSLIHQVEIGHISMSRFNRRLHALRELFTGDELYVIDSMPMPVCKRVRARRCGKVRGRAYCGYCAAKKERSSAGACI